MAQPKPYDPLTGSDYEPSEQPTVLTPVESRQGVISGRVLMILTSSLVLALIAFVVLYSAQIL